MESMTQAPYLLPGAREGYRIGDKSVIDSMMYDGLFCAFDQVAMGAGTENTLLSLTLVFIPPVCRVSESVKLRAGEKLPEFFEGA